MKIILNDDIEHLGEEGDVVTISDGYARNFLFPKRLALPYTKQNISLIASRHRAIAERKRQRREKVLSLKDKLAEVVLRIPASVGERGRLFGSVTSATLSEHLYAQGLEISRRNIELSTKHIKYVGDYTAKVKLYGIDTVQCTFSVVSDQQDDSVETNEPLHAGTPEVAVTPDQETVAASTGQEQPAVPEQTEDEISDTTAQVTTDAPYEG